MWRGQLARFPVRPLWDLRPAAGAHGWMARWLDELPWARGSHWPWRRWRGRDERGWLVVPPPSPRFRRLPQAPVCEPHTDGREEKVSLSPPPSVLLGDSGPPCHGLGESPTGGEREGVARGLAVRDGRSEHLAVLQAQRSWAGGSRGLGTRVALGPMAWRGRVSSSRSCPGWCSCGSEGCSIPALETDNQPGSLPTAQVSGNPGPIRASAESLWLLSSLALLQRAASCSPPTAGFSRLLCQLPGRHASRHSLQIHVHGRACVSACLHMYLRMCMHVRVCTHIYVYIHVHVCPHVCMSVCVYMSVGMHACACATPPKGVCGGRFC